MPHTREELEQIGIFQWESVSDSFEDADLLIGNGFSINLYNSLSYTSLFEYFIAELNSEEEQRIFRALGTHNFEYIIQILNNSELVNNLLQLPVNRFEPLRNRLRQGLITSIQTNHPQHADINYDQLGRISEELEHFNDIYTTNYDVLLYKILLQSISHHRNEGNPIPYQDYFYDEIDAHKLGFMADQAYNARSIYYLHGALFLYQSENRTLTYKLRRFDDRLEYIQLIRREIQNDNFPIFVAEGDPADKLATITSNRYLNYCSTKLSNTTRNILVYGFSFSAPDVHITNFLKRNNSHQVAVSIRVGNKTLEELETESSYFRNNLDNKEVAVIDSTSVFNQLNLI